MPALHGLWMHS